MALAVDKTNELKDYRNKPARPAALRIFAKIISIVFHPLFIPVYLSLVVVRTKPYFFSSLDERDQKFFIPQFVLMYVFFPLVSVLLLKALKFIDSIMLKTQRDRIAPYIVCMIYYWWMWYVMKTRDLFPKEVVMLSFSIFLASVAGLLANIYMKISMHTIAAGIMVAFITYLGFSGVINATLNVSIAIFIAGLICTSRLIDSDHRPKEIYGGIIVGLLCFLAAIFFT